MPDELDAYLNPAPKPRRGNYDDLIQKHAARTGLNADLIRAVMGQESGGNPNAVSPKGARGPMQLMPATAKRFGVTDPRDPEQAIRGGADYLKFLNDRFHGNRDLVLAGYNAGEGAVEKFGNRVPPYRETQNYVKSINARLGQRQQKPTSDLDSYLDPSPSGQTPPTKPELDKRAAPLDSPAKRPSAVSPASPSVPIEQVLGQVAQQANRIAPRISRRFSQKPPEPQVIDAGNAVDVDPETMRPREAPAMQARVPSTWERVKETIGPYVPGLTSLDTPGGVKTDPVRGAISGLTLGAFGDPRQVSREEQILDPEAQAKADLAHQVGQFAPAVVPYMAAERALSAIPLLGQATRTANIARTALTFGGVELGREAVRAGKTDTPLDPKEIAISTAIGASIGGIAGVDPSLKRRVVAFVTPSVVADVARGTDPQTATFNALTNLGFALHGGERDAKDTKADVPASLRNDPQVRELIDRARADVRRAIDEKGGPAQGEATTPDRKAAAKQAFRLPLIEPNELTGRLKGQLSKPLEITYESESGKELTRTTTIGKRLKELSRKQDVLDRLVDCLHG